MPTTPGTSVINLPAYSAPVFSASRIAIDAAVTSVTLESTTASAQTNIPFTFGQSFKKGDIAPGNFLVGRTAGQADVPLQFNVKSTHPDGSVRHAIISGVLPSLAANGTRVLSLVRVASSAANTTPTASNALTTAGFTASLVTVIGGVAYTASPNAALTAGMAGTSVHIGGSLATEWTMMLPLVDGSGNAHPLLVAQFNVRHYPGAARAKVGVTIENTNAYGAVDNVAYSATLTIGGVQVYTYPNVTHYHATRFYREAWWGTQPALHIKHDSTYLTKTKQVPNYDLSVVMNQAKLDEWATLINDAAKFGPMGAGPYAPYMAGTGGRPDIGLNPAWAAATVISMDKRAKALTLAGAACGGSWGCHRRDVSTGPGRGYPLSVINFPRATWLGTVGDGFNDSTGVNEKLPTGSGGNPNTEDNAHTPNFSYLAYLLTGDLFYLEEILFYSSWVVYFENPYFRQMEKGVLDANSMDQIRAQGWAIRALADAAAITPDAHYLKTHFRYWLDNTLAAQNGRFTDNPSANGLGVNDSYLPYNPPTGDRTGIAFWQDDHFTSAVGHAAELGFTEAGRLLQWKSKFQVARLLHPDWCYQDACLYIISIKSAPGAATFNTWAEVKAGTVGCPEEGRGIFDAATIAAACGSPERLAAMNASRAMPSDPFIAGQITGYAQNPDGFVANLQPALAYAVDSGYTDGDLAWDLFDSRTVKPDYGTSPQFAIVPRVPDPLITVAWAVFDTTSPPVSPTNVKVAWAAFDTMAPPVSSGATVTGVTVSPSTATGSAQFNATVQGTNSPSQAVTWSKTGPGTLSTGGLFTAPAATGSVQTTTITATSDADPTKSGAATVTIAAVVAPSPTVSSVTISPDAAVIAALGTRQYSAVVAGSNSPSQAVTWATNLGQISSGGVLTAPAATTSVQTGTITATSVLDPSKNDTATFTMLAEVLSGTPTRTINIILGTESGLAANLTDLMVSFHAAAGPHATGTALFQSSTESTDASGLLTFSMQTSAIASGASGLLSVLMPDGHHYLGLVTVA